MVLQLRNGDRLTGKLISETTNQVVIATTWAPSLTVPLVEIAKREVIPLGQIVVTNALTNVTITTSATATNITTNVVVNGLVAKPPEVKPKGPQHWHGDVQIGTDLGFSEKERQLYYGRFKFTYGREIVPHRFFKNTFDLNGTYGRTDGITSANQVTGSSKTDFDLTKRVFVYNLVGAGYDEIRKIDFQYEFGPGFGYHVLMLTNFVMNTEIGMNYQAQYFKGQKTLERYFYRLAEDSKWFINKKLSFDEKFEFFPQADLEQYRLRFESNLRYTFMENFIFTLTLLDTFDTQPANGVSPNDLQIRSSLGLKF
ncbi:MAG: hypothetical protein JWM68_2013 [Verrucomicrobiales bacterium]|nr:hypothetical protein [Verrucomicrobiales bacterium]